MFTALQIVLDAIESEQWALGAELVADRPSYDYPGGDAAFRTALRHVDTYDFLGDGVEIVFSIHRGRIGNTVVDYTTDAQHAKMAAEAEADARRQLINGLGALPHDPATTGSIQHPDGGWQRANDYCDQTPRGSGLVATTDMTNAADELTVLEQGLRVANAALEEDLYLGVPWDLAIRYARLGDPDLPISDALRLIA